MNNSPDLPAVFVVDHDPRSLDATIAALVRRFGNDYAVQGVTSRDEALEALRQKANVSQPVALLLCADADSDLLAQAHDLHPHAKRVLVVDRDYTRNSPAVQAIALGR